MRKNVALPAAGEAVAGGAIVITKRGMPFARLGPTDIAQRHDTRAAVEELRRWREEQRMPLDGLSLREMIEEGWR